MRKKITWVMVGSLVILGLLWGSIGCAAPTPTATTPTTTVQTKASPTLPAQKPVVLKWAEFSPRGSARTDTLEWWAKEIEKRTAGAVKIEFFWAEALAKGAAIPDAVQSGIADIGTFHQSYAPAKVPLLELFSIPGGGATAPAIGRAHTEIFTMFPQMQEMLTKINAKYLPLASAPTYGFEFHFNRQVTSLAEIKGLKVRAAIGSLSKLMDAIGAVPVNVAVGDIYTSLQTKVIDGWPGPLYVMLTYKTVEVAPNVLMNSGIGGTDNTVMAMNLDVWNGLTADTQKIILEVSNESNKILEGYAIAEQEKLLGDLKAKGAKIYELSTQDRQVIVNATKPLWDEWIKKVEAQGIPGQKMADAYRSLVTKYDQEYAQKK